MQVDLLSDVHETVRNWVIPVATSVVATFLTARFTKQIETLALKWRIALILLIFCVCSLLFRYTIGTKVSADIAQTATFGSGASSDGPGGARSKSGSSAPNLNPNRLPNVNLSKAHSTNVRPVDRVVARPSSGPPTPDFAAALENAEARATAAGAYWDHIGTQLENDRHTLRPEIVADLAAARLNAARCQQNADAQQWQDAQACIDQLSKHLDKLDSYK